MPLGFRKPGERGYKDADVTGTHVLGYWNFEEGSAPLSLQGAEIRPGGGRFGAGLESFPGFPVQDKRHGALTDPAPPKLSPKGAFTLEMWVKPKPEFATELRCFLLDKKYVDHTDYQWQITEADKSGQRRLFVTLGFGAESKAIYSDPIRLETDVWRHLAFSYDGAGLGSFSVDGRSAGGMKLAGVGSIVPGTKALSIGDRLGSNYGGFPGFIDEVRISDGVLNFERVSLEIVSARQVYRRKELAKPVDLVVTNLQRQIQPAAKLLVSFGDKEDTFIVPELASGKSYTAKLQINTSLKPERYSLRAKFVQGDYSTERSAEFTLVPRLPPRMPVVMWGAGGEEIDRLKDIGFTHFVGFSADGGEMWQEKKLLPPGKPDYIARNRRYLDDALANGLEVVASLSPGRTLESDPKNLRVDREGNIIPRQGITASEPAFGPFFNNVGQSVAKAYGDHPAFTSVLINSEVRDHTSVSFNAVDVESYRKFANADIPAEVVQKTGVDWTKLKDFPADRVIADDHPILKYYRWFWTVGDGWNNLHSELNKGIKITGRRDLWTFFDPAVRQPSISGAGGSVDVLSHWTYTYPDPLKIGLCADQLFAMSAASGKNQRVMKMTQLIWYRSQTAPIGSKAPGETVAWEDHDPEAAYVTIAPMHLKSALWSKIARPVQGIMYHGWQSLVPTDSTSAYRYTHPDTVHVLRDLIRDVIEPLGPTLMAIPDERSEVALLESFTSQMFARRGSYGSNTDWAADVWLALQHAHVQTDILYEETLLKRGLSGRKLLVMPYCDVLTASVVKAIQDWQKRGGKILADEHLCPALKADYSIASFRRSKKASEDKAQVLQLAKQVESFNLPQRAQCDNPEIIVRTRRSGDALYVFVVNDKREPGSYVGQHGLVMENGLPSSGTLSLPQDSAHVYDLTEHRLIVPKRDQAGLVSWPVHLGPCDGKVYMVTSKPLLNLSLDLPEQAAVDQTAKLTLQLTTTQQADLQAIVPIKVTIRDASGRQTEGTGHYAALNGKLDLELSVAPNEAPGTWEIQAQELASGLSVRRWMQVLPKAAAP